MFILEEDSIHLLFCMLIIYTNHTIDYNVNSYAFDISLSDAIALVMSVP